MTKKGHPGLDPFNYVVVDNLDLSIQKIKSLERTLFKIAEDQFTSKVAKTIEEAQKFVDVGFKYVCDFGNDG